MEMPRCFIQGLGFNWEIWGELNKSSPYNGVGWDREPTKESTALLGYSQQDSSTNPRTEEPEW